MLQTTPTLTLPLKGARGTLRRAVNEQVEPKVPPVTPFLRFEQQLSFPLRGERARSARGGFGMGVVAAVMLFTAAPAATQQYPAKVVRIVTSEPGSTTDILARVAAQ